MESPNKWLDLEAKSGLGCLHWLNGWAWGRHVSGRRAFGQALTAGEVLSQNGPVLLKLVWSRICLSLGCRPGASHDHSYSNCVVGQNLWLFLWTVAVGIQFKQVNRLIHVLNFGSVLCSVSPKSESKTPKLSMRACSTVGRFSLLLPQCYGLSHLTLQYLHVIWEPRPNLCA